MRTYKTSTGFTLQLIQGGLSDKPQFETAPKNIDLSALTPSRVETPLDKVFRYAGVSIVNHGYGDEPYIQFVWSFDAKYLKKFGLGQDVVDVSNWLNERFDLGVSNPSVDGLKDRARHGFKVLTFLYKIHVDEARRLGFQFKYGETLRLQG